MNNEELRNIIITPTAAIEINKIRETNQIPESHALRIGLKDSGCCGVSYFLAFDEKPEETDTIIDSEGIKIYVDQQSLSQLKGATLEYVNGPQGCGFRLDNPNDDKSCNCDDGCCG